MTTPNLNLTLPNAGERNTAQALNNNFAAIEAACAPLQNVSGNHGLEVVNGELRAKVGSGLAINANGELQGPSTSFSDLTDVQVTNPTNQQYLMYKGGKWVNSNGTSINDVPDIEITNPQVGDYLRWDGEKYVNRPIGTATSIASCSDVQLTSLANYDMLFWDGTKFVNKQFKDVGFSDVAINNPQNGQVLIYDGEKWVNGDIKFKIGPITANHCLYANASGVFAGNADFLATSGVAPNFTKEVLIGGQSGGKFFYSYFNTTSNLINPGTVYTTAPTYSVNRVSVKRVGNMFYIDGIVRWIDRGTYSGVYTELSLSLTGLTIVGNYSSRVLFVGPAFDYYSGVVNSNRLRIKGHNSGSAAVDIALPYSGTICFSICGIIA